MNPLLGVVVYVLRRAISYNWQKDIMYYTQYSSGFNTYRGALWELWYYISQSTSTVEEVQLQANYTSRYTVIQKVQLA